ncbi:MAG: leucine-rich repeat domain-containing protein [Saprospiraceae bacterium]|nr:leucine-rich repeat domain-containing protein [Saprospiraceae bacterium]
MTKRLNILSENILYINNLGIDCIPKEAFEHPTLEHLDLSYNNIVELGKELSRLVHLKHLDLSNNKLQSLPNSIATLKHLEVLILSNNQLSNFPEVISKLTKLKVLKLKGNNIKTVPTSIEKLYQLELLDLGFNAIRDLPLELGNLPLLKELICTSNHFSVFPEVLLEMEQLDHLEKLDLHFRLKFPVDKLKQLYKVLRILKKRNASFEIKNAAFQIFMNKKYTGSIENIIPLLLINYVSFSQSIRNFIVEHFTGEIYEKSKIAVLGKTEWINKDMWPSEIDISNQISPLTTHIVVGKQISKLQLEYWHPKMAFISEKMLLAYLYPRQPAKWILEHQGKIIDLLLSEQNENISLALQIAKDNELLDKLLTELLMAYTSIDTGNFTLRNEMKAIFYRRMPDFDPVILPKSSFKFYTPNKSEQLIYQGIKNVTEQSPYWDGLKVAEYLFKKHKVAFSYILDYSSKEQEKQWFEQFIEGDIICLSPIKKLNELPTSITFFDKIKTISLKGCNFRKIPDPSLLNQLPNLELIDLRENPISFIPKGMYRLVSKFKILLTK